MKPQYLVTVIDKLDMQPKLIWLKDLEELSTFLTHVDTDAYIIGDTTATEINPSWKDFCKKEKTLELGG